jgi:hypothetical protein
MADLDLAALTSHQRPTGAWAAALLRALARDEVAGRRPVRLTEPQLATWTRFRGRLTATDLVTLLFEDAAVLHRVPFDPAVLGDAVRLTQLPPDVAAAWLTALASGPHGPQRRLHHRASPPARPADAHGPVGAPRRQVAPEGP